MRLTPCKVCTVVFLLPLTSPWYAVFKHVSRRPASPMTTKRRRTRKAVMRVASVLAGSDHIATIVLTRPRSSFLKDRKYGSSGSVEVRVSFSVAASESVVRR